MNTELTTTIATQLKLVRTEAKFTIEDLSKKTGLDPGTISRYENANARFSLDIIARIVTGCNKNLKNFFDDVFAKMQQKEE